MDFNEMKLDDVGTRYEHYAELLDAWESAKWIIENMTIKSTVDEERLKKLIPAIELLRWAIDNAGNYYSWRVREQVEEIDYSHLLNKPETDYT